MSGISGKHSDLRVTKGNWNFTDDTGAVGTFTVFNVTGDIACVCCASVDAEPTSTANNGTLELGIAGNTAGLLVQDVADSTAFQIGDSWTLIDASDDGLASLADELAIIGNGADIIMTIGTNAMLTGDIDFYCLWRPLSSDGNVEAA